MFRVIVLVESWSEFEQRVCRKKSAFRFWHCYLAVGSGHMFHEEMVSALTECIVQHMFLRHGQPQALWNMRIWFVPVTPTMNRMPMRALSLALTCCSQWHHRLFSWHVLSGRVLILMPVMFRLTGITILIKKCLFACNIHVNHEHQGVHVHYSRW